MTTSEAKDRNTKSVHQMIHDAYAKGDASELSVFVEGGGKIPRLALAELLARAKLVKKSGGQSGLRLKGTPAQQNAERAKLCAAYIVRCCADYYRDEKKKQATPRNILEMIEKKALASVNATFKVTLPEFSVIGPASYADMSTRKRHGLHERRVHDEIVLLVHDTKNNKMHTALMKILKMLADEYLTPRK